MGLCNGERLTGIFHAVKQMTQIVDEWDNDKETYSITEKRHKLIKTIVGKMWHGVLGSETNGVHWFLGSSSSNTIVNEPRSAWEMAIVHHLSDVTRSLYRDYSFPENNDFKPLDYLKISNLMKYGFHFDDSYVFQIFQWAEQLSYYLRRYKDEFLKEYDGLNKLLSDLFGACFAAFAEEDSFAKAYVIRQIVEILYANENIVEKMLEKHSLHHDLGKLMCSLPMTDLVKVHVELVRVETKAKEKHQKTDTLHKFVNEPSVILGRCVAMLKLIRKDSAVKVLEDLKTSDLSGKIKQLQSIVKQKGADRPLKSSTDYDYNNQLDAYGYQGYKLLEKGIPKKDDE